MKKIISTLLALTMMASLFVVNVSAEKKSITMSTTVTAVTAADYNKATKKSLKDGYTSYLINIKLENYGTLSDDGDWNDGRKINNVEFALEFSDISAVDREVGFFRNSPVTTSIGKIQPTVAFDGNKLKGSMLSTSNSTSFPYGDLIEVTYNSNNDATKIDVVNMYVAVKGNATATVSGSVGIGTYSDNTVVEQEKYDNKANDIVFDPATITFGDAFKGRVDAVDAETVYNYGFLKLVDKVFNTENYTYTVKATDAESKETETWDLLTGFVATGDFEDGELEGLIKKDPTVLNKGKQTFYIVVRSSSHKIGNVELIEKAKPVE